MTGRKMAKSYHRKKIENVQNNPCPLPYNVRLSRMPNTKTQYRVAFMSWENVNGNCVQKEFSTQWYDQIEKCEKWMHEIGARIVTREYTPEPFPWKHYLETVGS